MAGDLAPLRIINIDGTKEFHRQNTQLCTPSVGSPIILMYHSYASTWSTIVLAFHRKRALYIYVYDHGT